MLTINSDLRQNFINNSPTPRTLGTKEVAQCCYFEHGLNGLNGFSILELIEGLSVFISTIRVR